VLLGALLLALVGFILFFHFFIFFFFFLLFCLLFCFLILGSNNTFFLIFGLVVLSNTIFSVLVLHFFGDPRVRL
jgi:hypothetical protein